MFNDDLKPKEICSHCLIKLNDFYDFVALCHSSNDKFEGMLYEFETGDRTSHRYHSKSYNPQKSSVIVASKNIPDNLTDCTDLIMMVQYKDSTILPLDNFDVQNCPINEQDVLNVANEINMEQFVTSQKRIQQNDYNNHTVLRHSGELCKSTVSYMQVQNYDNSVINNNITKETGKSSTENIASNLLSGYYEQPSDRMLNEYAANIVTDISNIEPIVYNSAYNNIFKASIVDNKVIDNQNNIDFNTQTTENVVSKAASAKLQKTSKKTKKVNSKSFTCANCNKTFVRKLSLKAHMAVHTNIRPFVCKTCHKSFAVRWDLTSHQKVHAGLHRCHYCPKSFAVPSKLERHERIHRNDRPFACTFEGCNKTFSDKRNLVGHEATHSNVREFTCEVCNRKYKTKSQLNDHNRAHKDETPFQCHVCSKSYKWKTNLIIHLKKHTGYKCGCCGKDCGKLSMLVKHRKECRRKDTA